jgi:predicted transcriptional regulator
MKKAINYFWSIKSFYLENEMRTQMLSFAARSEDPELLKETIGRILKLQDQQRAIQETRDELRKLQGLDE